MPQPITKADVKDLDFIDAYELASDGRATTSKSVYLTTSGVSTTALTQTVVSTMPSDGEGLLTSDDHPVQVGDLLFITGSLPGGAADGQYTVASIPTDTSVTVVQPIADSTGGTLTWVYPSGASEVGFNPAGQSVTTANNLEQAVTDIANAITVAPGGDITIRFPLGTGASQVSTDNIPAGAVVKKAYVDIFDAYPTGTVMRVGHVGSPGLLMDAPDIFPNFVSQYEASQDTLWGGSNLPVLVTVFGSPAYGSGECVVTYSIPLS
jgi:hypothetical protein